MSPNQEPTWKTLRNFPSVIDAQIAQSKLESDGIECFIRDEFLASVNVLLTPALGGIRLDVKEIDYERALAALDDVVDPT